MQSNLKLGSMAPFTGKPSLSQSLELVGGLNQIYLYFVLTSRYKQP